MTSLNIPVLKDNNVTTEPAEVSSVFAFIIFGAIVGLILFLLILKKLYFYFFHKKRYYIIPRVSVTGMTNIAMVIAIAVSIIILIMAVTGGIASVFFRAYPGTRVTIEIILIKISGLLFGPVIGLISGAIIDILAIALSAGFFHYGYFIAAIVTGLISGILRTIITLPKSTKYRDLFFAAYTSLFVGFSAVLVILTLNSVPSLDAGLSLTVPGMNINIALSKVNFFIVLIAFSIAIIIFIWCAYAVWLYRCKNYDYVLTRFKYKKYKHANHRHSLWLIARNNWYSSLVSVVALAASSALVVNILFLPIFDAQITGQPYQFWLMFRMIVTGFLFFMDVIVIYPVLLVITPIMKYNYEDELVEDLKVPLFYNVLSSTERANVCISEKKIIECSKSLLFSLDDKQLAELSKEFSDILMQFEHVAGIDTTGLEPTHYPINVSVHNFREDVVVIKDNIDSVMECPNKVENELVKVY